MRHFVNMLLYYLPPSRFFYLRNFLLKKVNVNIGRCVSFCGFSWIYGNGKLVIGDETWISPRSIFYTHKDALIIIGQRCDIGPGVKFITGSHVLGNAQRRAGTGYASPIVVGNGTWIGAQSVIVGGVTIGEGSVVAAGSVVIGDVPANSLVAGIPAVVKRIL